MVSRATLVLIASLLVVSLRCATALAVSPVFLIADEPTGDLDTRSSQEIFDIFKRINREEGLTIIVATHNPKLGSQTDRIIYLKDANPIRLFILHGLGQRDCSVAELQKALGISVPNLSQHLAILKSASVVVTRREGKRVYCHLPIPEVRQACNLIHNVLRRQIKESNTLVS
jgi:ABC-type multidrug transport system ATPase subunit